jgi:hypothetical protein
MTKPLILPETRLTAIPNLDRTRAASRDSVYGGQPANPGNVVAGNGDAVRLPATWTSLIAEECHG